MTWYRYNEEVSPAAPFVHVAVSTPDGARSLGELPALLDTAADKTVIPARAVDELALLPTRDVVAFGLDGHLVSLPAFLVQVTIRQQGPIVVEALSSGSEPYVLLGRDVLNHYRVMLDGRARVLDIE